MKRWSLSCFVFFIGCLAGFSQEPPPYLNDRSYKGTVNQVPDFWYWNFGSEAFDKAQQLWAEHLRVEPKVDIPLPYGRQISLVLVPPGYVYNQDKSARLRVNPFYISTSKTTLQSYWAITGDSPRLFDLKQSKETVKLSSSAKDGYLKRLSEIAGRNFKTATREQNDYLAKYLDGFKRTKINDPSILANKERSLSDYLAWVENEQRPNERTYEDMVVVNIEQKVFESEAISPNEIENFHKKKNPNLLITPFTETQVNEARKNTASELGIPAKIKIPITQNSGMEMILIPAGLFRFGNENKYANKSKFSSIRTLISEPFYMAINEISESHFDAIIHNSTKTQGAGSEAFIRPPQPESMPKSGINRTDAQMWVKIASNKIGMDFDIPSEIQWEYCCKAGDSILPEKWNLFLKMGFGFPDFRPNHFPSGEGEGNNFGLMDIDGNLLEICKSNEDNLIQTLLTSNFSYPVLKYPVETALASNSTFFARGNFYDSYGFNGSGTDKFAFETIKTGVNINVDKGIAYRKSKIGFRPILIINNKSINYLTNIFSPTKNPSTSPKKYQQLDGSKLNGNLKDSINIGDELISNPYATGLPEMGNDKRFIKNADRSRYGEWPFKIAIYSIEGTKVQGEIKFFAKNPTGILEVYLKGKVQGQFKDANTLILSWNNPEWNKNNQYDKNKYNLLSANMPGGTYTITLDGTKIQGEILYTSAPYRSQIRTYSRNMLLIKQND